MKQFTDDCYEDDANIFVADAIVNFCCAEILKVSLHANNFFDVRFEIL